MRIKLAGTGRTNERNSVNVKHDKTKSVIQRFAVLTYQQTAALSTINASASNRPDRIKPIESRGGASTQKNYYCSP